MREWWLRTVLVLSAPRAVFVALRADSGEEAAQRVGAGARDRLARRDRLRALDARDGAHHGRNATARLRRAARRGLGVPRRRPLRRARLLGARRRCCTPRPSGSARRARYRRSRHVLAFAAVPVALSLAALAGRSCCSTETRSSTPAVPTPGPAARSSRSPRLGFLAWSRCLLVIGVRAVHGWRLGRAPCRDRGAARDPARPSTCSDRGAREGGLEPLELRLGDRVGVLLLGERAVADRRRRRRRAPPGSRRRARRSA